MLNFTELLTESITQQKLNQIYLDNIHPLGTIEQYSRYVNKAFPNSKVKKIVYRSGFLQLKTGQGGIWFGESGQDVIKFAKYMGGKGDKLYKCLINITNPKIYDRFWWGYLVDVEKKYNFNRDNLMNAAITEGHDGIIIEKDVWNDVVGKNRIESEQYVVFDVNNIHVLGDENDKIKFKKYLNGYII